MADRTVHVHRRGSFIHRDDRPPQLGGAQRLGISVLSIANPFGIKIQPGNVILCSTLCFNVVASFDDQYGTQISLCFNVVAPFDDQYSTQISNCQLMRVRLA